MFPRPLVYLGKISYGLDLFHDLFVQFIFRSSDIFPKMAYFQHHNLIAIPIAFVLTVATAALSYHFFERPILKFKERFETIKTRPATFTLNHSTPTTPPISRLAPVHRLFLVV